MRLRSFGRALGIAGAGLLLLALAGCGEDNEKKANIVGTTTPPGSQPTARSYEDYNKQQLQRGNPYQGGGYPGAGSAKK
jgi:hypothetical protein